MYQCFVYNLYTRSSEKPKKIKASENREPITKKIRLSTYPEIDKAMEIWFRDVKHGKNIAIDGPLIQEQALKFATLLGKICILIKIINNLFKINTLNICKASMVLKRAMVG